ncbi:hypothetical protein AAMO2058_000936500 [Amorphochlora amoebiformis]
MVRYSTALSVLLATAASGRSRSGLSARTQISLPRTPVPNRLSGRIPSRAITTPQTDTTVNPSKSTPYENHLKEASLFDRVLPPRLSPIDRLLTRVQFLAYGSCFLSIGYTWCLAAGALQNIGALPTKRKEKMTIKFLAKLADSLLHVFPFMKLNVYGRQNVPVDPKKRRKISKISDMTTQTRSDSNRPPLRAKQNESPVVWVANHVSELDMLVFLILEGRLSIASQRPIKFLYWKRLESYPILRRFLKTCGMIPVDMEDTPFDLDNQYRLDSVKTSLRAMDEAIKDGFDIAILPEGRRNPNAPTLGKMFPGAYRLAKKHGLPIYLLGTHGVEELCNIANGLHARSKEISVRFWPKEFFKSQDNFTSRFYQLLGPWAASKVVVEGNDPVPKVQNGEEN